MIKILLAILGIVVAGVLVYFGPDIHRHFGTRYQSAERDIFEQNKSYIQGKIENLERMKLEYETAEGLHKKALREAILTQMASFDMKQLPDHLYRFIDDLRRGEVE